MATSELFAKDRVAPDFVGEGLKWIHRRTGGSDLYFVANTRADHTHINAPNKAPTPAVSAMASAPRKVTRATDLPAGEPPARAARAPNNARNTSELHDTVQTSADNGTTKTSGNGNAAPTANVPAEANAACTGRALSVSEIPSSSRACAPGASLAISWVATLPDGILSVAE